MKEPGSIQGTVTVLFTDVVGSTALRTGRGDNAAQELMHAHARIVREGIAKYGGREIKTIGDSFMVAFASSLSAIACACEIQRRQERYNLLHPDRSLSVRIGLNCGEAVQEGGDLFGAAVNAAARIMHRAEGGQILVSDVVRNLSAQQADLQFVDIGPQPLAGFPEAWRLHEVAWREEESVASSVRHALDRKTPFIGREAELAELRGVLEEAARGRGEVAMIPGEPGLGKSRLAAEASAFARDRGFLVLTGHCFEAEGAPAYGPFIEALTPLVSGSSRSSLRKVVGDDAPWLVKLLPTLAEKIPRLTAAPSLPPDQERHLLLNSIVSFIVNVAGSNPVLLVLEDLHWADQATLLLLQYLSRGIAAAPVAVVGTYRDVQLSPPDPLTETLARLHEQQLYRSLPLERFDLQGVSQMLLAFGGEPPPPGLVEAVYAETEGNPFFVEEVVKFLAGDGLIFDEAGGWRSDLAISTLEVPSGVRLVIGRRLSRLSEIGRATLSIASVIGRNFGYAVLEAACGLKRGALLDAIDEAEKSHLIAVTRSEDAARFSFAHELIRQTLYADLSLPRRQDLHARVIKAIEKVYADRLSEHAPALAYHYLEAGTLADRRKAFQYLCLAGDQAMSNSAFEEAARYYGQATPLIPDEGKVRGDLLFKLGLARWSASHWDDAVSSWSAAISAYEVMGEIEGVERTCYAMAMLFGWRGRFADALQTVQRGLVAGTGSVSESRCRLLALAGTMLSLGGQPRGAEPLIAQALTIAEQRGDEALLGNALSTKGLHEWTYAQFQESHETLIRAEELLRRSGDLAGLTQCFGYLTTVLGYLGLHAEMDLRLAEYGPLARKLGASGPISSHAVLRAVLALVRGELADAERWALEAVEVARESAWLVLPTHLQVLGAVRFHAGLWESAEELLAEADSLLQKMGSLPAITQAWALLFYSKAFRGDIEGAQRLLPRLEELKKPINCGRFDALVTASAGLVVLGLGEQAAEFYPTMSAMAEKGVIKAAGTFPLLRRVLGMVASANGWWADSVSHYEAALREGAERTERKELAETRFWYARMLLVRGEPGERDRGLMLLKEAIEGYREIGMPQHLDIAERLFAAGQQNTPQTSSPSSGRLSTIR